MESDTAQGSIDTRRIQKGDFYRYRFVMKDEGIDIKKKMEEHLKIGMIL